MKLTYSCNGSNYNLYYNKLLVYIATTMLLYKMIIDLQENETDKNCSASYTTKNISIVYKDRCD